MHTGTRATGRVVARTRAPRRRHLTRRRAHTVRPVEVTGSRVARMVSSKATGKRSTCSSRNRAVMANNRIPSTAHPVAATAHRNHSSRRDMGLHKVLTAVVGKAGTGLRVARTRLPGISNSRATHSSSIRRATTSTPARHQCRSISRRRTVDNNQAAGTGSSRWEGTMDSNSSSIRLMLADSSSSRAGMGSKGPMGAVVGMAEEETSPSGGDKVPVRRPGLIQMEGGDAA